MGDIQFFTPKRAETTEKKPNIDRNPLRLIGCANKKTGAVKTALSERIRCFFMKFDSKLLAHPFNPVLQP
jgi:hypothetical protein